MKYLYTIATVCLSLILFSCSSDDTPAAAQTGSMELKFDHILGDKNMQVVEKGDLSYTTTLADKQQINITNFGYYITNVVLHTEDGDTYNVPVSVSKAAAEGVYHIKESDASSRYITLTDIPANTYKSVSFTLGVPADIVQEGAAGGVLDPAAGAWFWNWNSGYIALKLEGHASTSTATKEEVNGEIKTYANSFGIHVGGWKDIAPAEPGQMQMFVNNVRTITLPLGHHVAVNPGVKPSVHIMVDAKKWLEKSGVDFSTTNSVHAPAKGKMFADVLQDMFSVDHVH